MQSNHGQFGRTMWLMLTYSWVSLIAISLFLAFFIFGQISLAAGEVPPERAFRVSLMLNVVLSAFIGIHLAGAQLGLKQFYLWQTNPNFRKTLVNSFLVLAGSFALIQTLLLAANINGHWLFLCIPFCSTIFAAQLVLEKTLLSRILVAGFPLVISQVSWLELSEIFYLPPIVIACGVIIQRMYSPDFFRKTGYLDLTNINQTQHVKSKPKLLTAINHLISLALSRSLTKKHSSVDWAVSMPHSKYALLTIGQLATIIPFFILVAYTTDGDTTLVETFVSLFTATICISVTMECRLLFFQLSSFTHLYSDNNHRELKNKILFVVDKIIVTNASVLLIGSLLLSLLFDLVVDLKTFCLTVGMITLISLVFSPLLLCLRWIKVSFPQVGILVVYGATLFGVARLFKTYEQEVNLTILLLVFVSMVAIARLITRQFFWAKPLEQLLKIA